jgi:hypothetical protein
MFIRHLYENEKMEFLELSLEVLGHDAQDKYFKGNHFRFCSAIMQGFYNLKDYPKVPSAFEIEASLKTTCIKSIGEEIFTDESCNVIGLNIFINAFTPDFSSLIFKSKKKQDETALLWMEYWLLRSAISFWLRPHKRGRKTLLPKDVYTGNVFFTEKANNIIFQNGYVPEDLAFNLMQNRFEQCDISIDVNQKTSNYLFKSKSMFALAWAEIWTYIQWNKYVTFCVNCHSVIRLNKQKNNTLCRKCPKDHYDKRISGYEETFRKQMSLAPSNGTFDVKNYRYRTKLISEIKKGKLTNKDVAKRLKERYGPIDIDGNEIDWLKQVGILEGKSTSRKS